MKIKHVRYYFASFIAMLTIKQTFAPTYDQDLYYAAMISTIFHWLAMEFSFSWVSRFPNQEQSS